MDGGKSFFFTFTNDSNTITVEPPQVTAEPAARNPLANAAPHLPSRQLPLLHPPRLPFVASRALLTTTTTTPLLSTCWTRQMSRCARPSAWLSRPAKATFSTLCLGTARTLCTRSSRASSLPRMTRISSFGRGLALNRRIDG